MIPVRIMHRVAAIGGGIALALGGLVAIAPAAGASAQSCYFHLQENSVDPAAAEAACILSAEGGNANRLACYRSLREIYIPAAIAYEGCRIAQQ